MSAPIYDLPPNISTMTIPNTGEDGRSTETYLPNPLFII